MSTTTNFQKHIILTQAQYDARKTAGTRVSGTIYEISDAVGVFLITGTTDPTTSTACEKVGYYYMNTTSGKEWKCTAISDSTYTWVKVMDENDIHAGSSTLDATLVANKQYILASQSATFEMVLPTTGTYQDDIEVIFSATAAFTPTTSGGTVVGDTLPTTISGKTYDLLFTWVGSGWLLNWLAW